MSASNGLAKPYDLISGTLFAKVELNTGLKNPSSPSDTSVDERKLHGDTLQQKQSTELIFCFIDEQLFIAQIHIVKNFWITD